MIPDWMKEVDIGPCNCSAVYHGKKSFIGKTIDGIFSFLQDAFVSETYAKRNGLLQSLDPRVKLLGRMDVVEKRRPLDGRIKTRNPDFLAR